jgi:signal transduction histidine kinase
MAVPLCRRLTRLLAAGDIRVRLRTDAETEGDAVQASGPRSTRVRDDRWVIAVLLVFAVALLSGLGIWAAVRSDNVPLPAVVLAVLVEVALSVALGYTISRYGRRISFPHSSRDQQREPGPSARPRPAVDYRGNGGSEVEESREAVERYARRLESLQEIDHAILAARSIEDLVHNALSRIREIVTCQRAMVSLYDFEGGRVVVYASTFHGETAFGAGTEIPIEEAGLGGEGAIAELRQGRLRVVDDLRTLPYPGPAYEAEQAEGFRSAVTAPLATKDGLVGVLTLISERPAAFGTEQIEVVHEVADQLAIALEQARLYEAVRRHAEELEERVAERTAQLQETNAELDAFAYSASHDLRAPLRAMHGFSRAILEDYSDLLDGTGKDYARRIVEAAERLDTQIDDLLAYSRLSREEIRLRPVSLERPVNEAIGQIKELISERRADVAVEHPLPAVVGHEPTLLTIVTNLASNGVKFVAPGQRPRLRIRADELHGRVRLWVEDNGPGIAPEHQGRIFRVFERLQSVKDFGGTGVGLAIVRKGVERMGGRVGVESAPGRGSRFWIELPSPSEEP